VSLCVWCLVASHVLSCACDLTDACLYLARRGVSTGRCLGRWVAPSPCAAVATVAPPRCPSLCVGAKRPEVRQKSEIESDKDVESSVRPGAVCAHPPLCLAPLTHLTRRRLSLRSHRSPVRKPQPRSQASGCSRHSCLAPWSPPPSSALHVFCLPAGCSTLSPNPTPYLLLLGGNAQRPTHEHGRHG
jgi:hypothetical protein